MATTVEFMDYISDMIKESGAVCKKLFGEYGVYCKGRMFGVICDNRFMVKVTQASESLLPKAPKEPPYEGAKPMLVVEDTDNKQLMLELAEQVSEQLPLPKPKKMKK